MVHFLKKIKILIQGWALTLLSDENKTFASTAQTIGLNTGYFLSFTVFLALNSSEFWYFKYKFQYLLHSNKFLRSVPSDDGLVPLGAYLQFWGLMFFCCSVWLILFKKEVKVLLYGVSAKQKTRSSESVDDVRTVYRTIWQVCKMQRNLNLKT